MKIIVVIVFQINFLHWFAVYNLFSLLKTLVAASPTMVGYVDASAVDASVKVVYKIP